IMGHSSRLHTAISLLHRWMASGAHRIDRNRDGQYDHQAAVALMDDWWGRLIRRAFGHELAHLYRYVLLSFDDPNRHMHLGWSFGPERGKREGYEERSSAPPKRLPATLSTARARRRTANPSSTSGPGGTITTGRSEDRGGDAWPGRPCDTRSGSMITAPAAA